MIECMKESYDCKYIVLYITSMWALNLLPVCEPGILFIYILGLQPAKSVEVGPSQQRQSTNLRTQEQSCEEFSFGHYANMHRMLLSRLSALPRPP